ncbi:hypothetical protein V2G26_016169 [Clonostachys chloroleuca]
MDDFGSRASRNVGEREPLLGRQSHHNRDHQIREASLMTTRPTFGQWIKQSWVDIVTMLVTGVVGQMAYLLPPVPTRYFAVTYADDQVVFPELAYPVRKVIVPIWLATLLAAGIPATCILAMQIRYRSFWDANNAIMGLLYSLVTAAAFQALLKWLIGGLRPHFLAACKPDMRLAAAAYAEKMGGAWDLDSNKESHHGDGFGNLYFTRDICTGTSWDVSDSLESFPSGHTTAVFAGFVFLSLYFNGKLKLFADHHSAMWKLILFHLPILGAILVGGSLTIDYSHNWYDVIAGAIIGTTMAACSYRMVYASVWDWRLNHIPLRRDNTKVGDIGDMFLPYGDHQGRKALDNDIRASHAAPENVAIGNGLDVTP